MIDLPVLQPSSPASGTHRTHAGKALRWFIVLLVVGIAWMLLLASVAPARLEGATAGALLLASSPPVLLTFVCWVATHIFLTPPSLAVANPSPHAQATADTATGPAAPVIRLRIGAWSVLTAHGNTIETIEGSRARNKMFKPDQKILHPTGYPAQASMIESLDLAAFGYATDTRLCVSRVTAMLCTILDDLHEQRATCIESLESPVHVHWLVPPALIHEDIRLDEIFARIWQQCAWRKGAYLLRVITVGVTSVFDVLTALQNPLEASPGPLTLIVAADSLVDREALASALALGQVFSHAAPDGFIPSEGAGGLLLFNPDQAADDLWSEAATIGRVTAMDRETDPNHIRSVITTALAAAGSKEADPAFVLSDTDHRSSASMAVIDAMAQVLPQLHPLEHRLSPMEYTGTFGAASGIIHIALAAELVEEKSVLVLATQGEHATHAVIVTPPSSQV